MWTNQSIRTSSWVDKEGDRRFWRWSGFPAWLNLSHFLSENKNKNGRTNNLKNLIKTKEYLDLKVFDVGQLGMLSLKKTSKGATFDFAVAATCCWLAGLQGLNKVSCFSIFPLRVWVISTGITSRLSMWLGSIKTRKYRQQNRDASIN